MRGQDGQRRKIRSELIDCRRMRVADFGAHAAWHPGAHSRGAYVNHDGHFQFIDEFEQRVEAAIVHREMAHDRVKVKSQHSEVLDSVPRLAKGSLPFERVNCRPGLDNSLWFAFLYR